MRIAVIGGGVSGLVAAHLLAEHHDVRLFEAAPKIGGHTYTQKVEENGREIPVDLGFIVYNERTYPLFSRLLADLGVATKASSMSFSVRCETSGFEYNGTNLNTLFAQRRNLLSPRFYRLLRGILRFHQRAPSLLAASENPTLGDWLADEGFRGPFVSHYLVPMVSAIWSAEPENVMAFPARSLASFLDSHGMLTVEDRPVWRVVVGGSRRYIAPLVARFADRIAVATPVDWIRRREDGVYLKPRGAEEERFDRVVIATHSDQALRLLADASPAEREILEAIPYRENDVVLHTDARFLPRRPLARASWNYHLNPPTPGAGPQMTYWMNLLQGLSDVGAERNYCVTLNRTAEIAPETILHQLTMAHPVYTSASVAAQRRWPEINGGRGTYFCGAYWGFGFHEDGVKSAYRVAEAIAAEAGGAGDDAAWTGGTRDGAAWDAATPAETGVEVAG
ncbi:MAG TPA: FAD-dependent oxidoreductase [Thermoanaerobaculia bacterium]|nr:FAD-dependent oxidoreductase [Thermoanaerobaculia bacterium]